MTISSPNELHQRLKNDPNARIDRFALGDRLCFFATHADGTHSVSGSFEVGDGSKGESGAMLDDLVRPEIGECGGPVPSPVVPPVEVIHECRVLGWWQWCQDDRYWIREAIFAGGFDVRISAIEVERARIDLRAETDKALIAAGWRLL
jgi:hypothetical protein